MALGVDGSITTQEVDSRVFPEPLYLSYKVKGEGVPNGQTLRVEYRTILDTYDLLEQVVADGSDAYQARVITLPVVAYHDTLDIRFVSTADSGSWRIDDVLLATELAPTPCPADLAAPFGTLDFSDVLAFLSAFGSMDPAADLGEPFGVFDFSDVLTFLTSFGEGCP
ncbi:MAG: GC-type dockerin domain-anchored protein [Phycisphaerales bacterium]